MTNEEAKFVLRAYRANGADASDEAFREALEQAKTDPELGRWFSTQQAFDRAVAAKMHEVAPPADLRDAILAGVKAGGDNAERSTKARRAWWRAPAWVGLAASIVLLLTVGLWTTRADANDMTEFAADYVARGFFLSEPSTDVAGVRAWLAEQKAPLPTELPDGFHRLRSLGCNRLDYRGKKISLICFGDGKEYHLFVARREDFPAMPLRTQPEYFKRKGLAGATWSDERNHYVAVTDASLHALKECIDARRVD